jgi:phosphoribosylglycinamide formyltransferase-1
LKKAIKAFGLSEARFQVAILVSGGGSNMEALIRAERAGQLPYVTITTVISSRADAGAIEKARGLGKEVFIIPSKSAYSEEQFQGAVLRVLKERGVDIICLAGYLKKIGPEIVQAYRGRILNIHPALLPKYGGAGMYGHFVHQAVIRACEVESGCTVHLVDDEYDHGEILGQARVPVQATDTPETLAARILEQEHRLYPQVLAQFCEQLAATGRKK